jgi:hypothetical protein
MGQRLIRRTQRQLDMKLSRRKNGALKLKERQRRQTRMIAILKSGKLPYTPPVMSWLSIQLDKPSKRITQAEVDALVQ